MFNIFKKKDPTPSPTLEADVIEGPKTPGKPLVEVDPPLPKEESIVTSPVPPEQLNKNAVTYSFPDAIREVINNRRITRLSWNTNDEFGLLNDGYLSIYREGKMHRWLVNDGDLLATDWVLLPEPN